MFVKVIALFAAWGRRLVRHAFGRMTTVWSIAGRQRRPQLSFADRWFHGAIEPARQFGMTQFRTRTQPVRAVLVLDASR